MQPKCYLDCIEVCCLITEGIQCEARIAYNVSMQLSTRT